ncbi:hypothetical protein LJR225_004406 [Phenylobacterium sp. LjRoot225]|uniref:hypothetical protein n=1 Tax=Phenylobacterium sp. LjRoot225 TaxID=3342285 RepID=UPI003ECF3329
MQARKLGLGLALAVLALAAPGALLAQEAPAAPAEPAAPVAGGLAFSGKTEMVEGPALQVVFGERAVFHLDDKGEPALDLAEKGPLAVAHPVGSVTESFQPPGAGKLAIALDGSPQKKASYLKVWNGLDHPVLFRAGVLAYEGGALKPVTVRVCAVPAGGTNIQTWPAPIAAVVTANFTAAKDAKACQ